MVDELTRTSAIERSMDVNVQTDSRARFVNNVKIQNAVVSVANRAIALYPNQLIRHVDLMLEQLNPTGYCKRRLLDDSFSFSSFFFLFIQPVQLNQQQPIV